MSADIFVQAATWEASLSPDAKKYSPAAAAVSEKINSLAILLDFRSGASTGVLSIRR